MTVALAATPLSVTNENALPFTGGAVIPLVSGVVITATDATAAFKPLPYIPVGAKVKLVVTTSAVGGTSPSITVDYQESVDGTNFNSTAAVTTGAITANGTVFGSVVTNPVFAQGRLNFTVTGTTPTATMSVYMVVWAS